MPNALDRQTDAAPVTDLALLGVPALACARYPDDAALQSAFTQFVFQGRDAFQIARALSLSPVAVQDRAEADKWVEERARVLELERDAVATALGRYAAHASLPFVEQMTAASARALEVVNRMLAPDPSDGKIYLTAQGLAHVTKSLKDIHDIGRSVIEMGTPSLRGAKADGAPGGDAPTVQVNVLQAAQEAVAQVREIKQCRS